MRGIAALMVALFHLGGSVGYNVPEGYLAVDLFFCLSGFVIALNYAGRLQRDMSCRTFMAKRLIRLYPLYFLGTVLGIARCVVQMLRIGAHAFAGTLIACLLGLFMLPMPSGLGGFSAPALFPINGPAWSLFLEMAVNVLFGIALFRLSSRRLAGVCLLAALYLIVRTGAPYWLNVGWIWPNFDLGIARTLYAFPLGMLLMRWKPEQRGRESWLAPGIVLMAAGLLCVSVSDPYRKGFELVVALAVMPMLLYGGICRELPRLLRRLAGFLGDISYGIYAVHWPLIGLFVTIAARMHWSRPASTAIFLTLLMAIGWCFHHGFDVPARRWLAKKVKPSRRHVPAILSPL